MWMRIVRLEFYYFQFSQWIFNRSMRTSSNEFSLFDNKWELRTCLCAIIIYAVQNGWNVLSATACVYHKIYLKFSIHSRIHSHSTDRIENCLVMRVYSVRIILYWFFIIISRCIHTRVLVSCSQWAILEIIVVVMQFRYRKYRYPHKTCRNSHIFSDALMQMKRKMPKRTSFKCI